MACLFLGASLAALAQTPATFYVRPDGGTGKQCDGSADTPYPGRGNDLHCAWAHPFWALKKPTEWKIRGGDRLLIAPGSYRMGIGPKNGSNIFDGDRPTDAHLPPLPSGPNPATPTILAGAGYDSGCPKKPELWGSRTSLIVDLSGTSNASVACLDITDHATCAFGHPTLKCWDGDAYAENGIYGSDEEGVNIVLQDLVVHGTAGAGLKGRFGSITLENVVLSANAGAGWDMDIHHRFPFSPTVRIDHSTIEWNGCVEDAKTNRPAAGGCWGEVEGGYGDGIGTDYQGGSWTITNSLVRYNTQDGLDLLYLKQPGAKVLIDSVTAYGNAGNQIKIAGQSTITNNVIIGNCAFFDGKPFSSMKDYFWEDATESHRGDHCRANGDALVVTVQTGTQSKVFNNTLVGEGDFLFWGLCQNWDDKPCDSASRIDIVNNIFRGFRRAGEFRNKKLARSGELVSPIFAESGVVHDLHHNLYFHLDIPYGDLHAKCPSGPGDVCSDPAFTKDIPSELFDGRLLPASPAIGAGIALPEVTADHDQNKRPPGAAYDIGAFKAPVKQ